MSEKIYTLRIDEDIFNKVVESAQNNRRSIAKQIEFILASYYETENIFGKKEYSPEIKEAFDRLATLINKEHQSK